MASYALRDLVGKNLGKVRKTPFEDCPQLMQMLRAEHHLQRAVELHAQADTDVEAFVPYGTSSARHKEQPGHAENRPTKERPLASSLLVHSRCPFSQNMLPAVACPTYWVRGRDAE